MCAKTKPIVTYQHSRIAGTGVSHCCRRSRCRCTCRSCSPARDSLMACAISLQLLQSTDGNIYTGMLWRGPEDFAETACCRAYAQHLYVAAIRLNSSILVGSRRMCV